MKIAFINFSPLVYDVTTPYKKPMGGSESAMCYLAPQLAKNGHNVILFTRFDKKCKKLGVTCVPESQIQENLKGLDFLVVQNSPAAGYQLRQIIDKKTKLILWTQHDSDQPAVESMNDTNIINSFNAFVLISDYQLNNYINKFHLDPKKCVVLRNAISPLFENLKPNNKLPILAYTSTPFRGLDLLIQMFPAIRNIKQDAILKVFSSLGVYHVSKEDDERSYGLLYNACRNTLGVEYIGSIPQAKLAKELSKVSILAYPNTFPETSCIAVMEAMAAGCFVVTSRLGALPETLAGFGAMIDIDGDWQKYGNLFIREILNFLYTPHDLSKQIKFVNKNYTWKIRAKQWEKWMKEIITLI